MNDYISREAVEQIIAAQCGECADACLEFDGIQPDCNQCMLYGAKKAIESIPAADVRPVVRAAWIEEEKDGQWEEYCSNCREHIPKGKWIQPWHSSYCPHCGAEMKG